MSMVRQAAQDSRISVVIPAHNQAQQLDVAIASIHESPLINTPSQVIVVDDDSHDQTEDVAMQRHATYVRVNNHNISRTRNAGLALAQTPYVTFLDHDDAWLPGNMEPQLSALEQHPDAAFAYGVAQCATENLDPLPWTFPSPPLASGLVPERLHLGYPNLGVVLFRREALSEVGGFDPRVLYNQDGDLMIRIAARREIVGVDVVGMLHRLRAPSKSRCDYYWANHREVTLWNPQGVGVGWRVAAKLRAYTRALFYYRFCEDAASCAAAGHWRDALECLLRASSISPARAVRHAPTILSIVLQGLHATQALSKDQRAALVVGNC
jgi:glycosyltransferase involved in cell wall biosynthesis